MGKLIDLTGKKFGRWTVVSRADNDKRGHACWLCRCECGTESVIPGSSLTTGNSKSCGCYRGDVLTERQTKHGLSNTRLYGIWEGIKSRCYNKNCRIYPYYGGRGIKMCDIWRDDVLAFYVWANSHGYADDLTIERIDVDGDYCPENCTWVPNSEQSKNRRSLVMVEIDGDRKHLAEWARQFDIPLRNVLARIYECGWDPISALMTPVGRKGAHARVKLPPAHVFQ